MKHFLSLAVVFILSVSPSSQLTPDEIFNDYVNKYNIRIGRSNVEKTKRIVVERYYQVEEHNEKFKAGEVDYSLSLNEISHLSDEERELQKTGILPKPDNYTDDSIPVVPNTGRGGRASPASFDWRSVSGVVRPVQDQGTCGSCWAFAAVGALEGQMSRLKNRHDKLSEQEVIECAKNPWTGALLGCNGGWDFAAYDHARDSNGVTYSHMRSYIAYTGYGCNKNLARVPYSKTAPVSSYKLQSGNEALMKETLYNVGPLYVTFYVASDFYSYRSGVYTDARRQCGNYYNNHGVLLVGYGTQNGIDYWLVKNSWGYWWGENGYFKIQRGINLCGIARDVSYPRLP